ncbi:unnamed protein product [Owenia fusiformis]|uniref:Uncharacterized protein n=1 Tax=Owenia fusiformis TaxID=6347 RepID=A0A8J1UNB3_OWEFU|nr:unnamed protein product [Owenia fusiformis]
MALREVKVCLLGESGVGKSSIVQRFVHDTFKPALESTIGASFMSKTLTVDEKTYKYQIWDTAGQEKYRALAPMYYRGAAAAVIVYDVTNESSFGVLKDWIKELQRHGPQEIVIAIAGNKCDLADLREVQYKDALAYAEQTNAIFVETSAKNATNVSEMFEAICRKLPDEDFLQSSVNNDRINLKGTATTKKKKCC